MGTAKLKSLLGDSDWPYNTAFIVIVASTLAVLPKSQEAPSPSIPLVGLCMALTGRLLIQALRPRPMKGFGVGWTACSLVLLAYFSTQNPCIGRIPALPFLIGLPSLLLLFKALRLFLKAGKGEGGTFCLGYLTSMFIFAIAADSANKGYAIGSGFEIIIYLLFALGGFGVSLVALMIKAAAGTTSGRTEAK